MLKLNWNINYYKTTCYSDSRLLQNFNFSKTSLKLMQSEYFYRYNVYKYIVHTIYRRFNNENNEWISEY